MVDARAFAESIAVPEMVREIAAVNAGVAAIKAGDVAVIVGKNMQTVYGVPEVGNAVEGIATLVAAAAAAAFANPALTMPLVPPIPVPQFVLLSSVNLPAVPRAAKTAAAHRAAIRAKMMKPAMKT